MYYYLPRGETWRGDLKKTVVGEEGMVAVDNGIGRTEEVEEGKDLLMVVVGEAAEDREETKAEKGIVEVVVVDEAAEGGGFVRNQIHRSVQYYAFSDI